MKTRIVWLVLVAGAASVAAWSGSFRAAKPEPMVEAASAFLGMLEGPIREKAAVGFDHGDREKWHYVPMDRPGASYGEMTDAQRVAARRLLRSALSTQGMLKVEAIVALENVLRELENGNPGRDPKKYVFRVFGTPGDEAGWSWRFEGHHLSLNFTLRGRDVVGVTPMFMGTNPGEVPRGLSAGMRVLAAEEDLARELMGMLTLEQRKVAVIAAEAPGDVLAVPGRPVDGAWPKDPMGLAVGEMTTEQRAVFDTLLDEYAHNLRGDLADRELARIRAAGIEKVRFCWAGPLERGKGHYYRIVGSTFAIEYDNTQNDANHVHTLWHDFERNFGKDALREHLHDHKH